MGHYSILHSQLEKLYCNNKATIHITLNPIYHERTKYIEIDCYLIREKLQDGIIQTFHIPPAQQPSNLLTKALGSTQFHFLLGKLGVMNINSNLRGMLRKQICTMFIRQLRKENPQLATLTFFLLNQFPCIEDFNINLQQLCNYKAPIIN